MNRFGTNFSISIFGESHGPAVGVVIDGIPAGIELSENDFTDDILRRSPSLKGTTSRKEKDIPKIISGVFNSRTTGAPLTILFENEETKPSDYEQIKNIPRPGHADFTAYNKYNGFNDYRGGGHFSGRLTLPLVAAGVIAKKIIHPMEISASISEIGGMTEYGELIDQCVSDGDSLGGTIKCAARNIPVGLGEPFFNSVESLIAHLVFSIPGVKGIEFGSGFKTAKMKGSQVNDIISDISGKTATNHAGGINGGITNGNMITFNVAFKPASSISINQKSIDLTTGHATELSVSGRHDLCFVLRTPVIVEAVTAIVLADLLSVQKETKQYH
ncbi:MAG TPA: chorismate synthase [bacterium]|nr:chorismate synthase [bacterium]HPS30715.1 chorismate synthase [bacterium]